MEEAEAEEEGLEHLRLVGLVEDLVRDERVGPQQVRPQAGRRLVRHLHAVLEHLRTSY